MSGDAEKDGRELGKVLREKRKEQTESGRTGRGGGIR